MSNNQFERFDRVLTPGGKGRINYKRMEPPNYSKVAAYSVILDSTATPTIYPADQVVALKE